ncbi:hypothetical protein ACFQX6_48405 [Streptosporangium lutulentum]
MAVTVAVAVAVTVTVAVTVVPVGPAVPVMVVVPVGPAPVVPIRPTAGTPVGRATGMATGMAVVIAAAGRGSFRNPDTGAVFWVIPLAPAGWADIVIARMRLEATNVPVTRACFNMKITPCPMFDPGVPPGVT